MVFSWGDIYLFICLFLDYVMMPDFRELNEARTGNGERWHVYADITWFVLTALRTYESKLTFQSFKGSGSELPPIKIPDG